jgi:CheY-like chemotaxis protein
LRSGDPNLSIASCGSNAKRLALDGEGRFARRESPMEQATRFKYAHFDTDAGASRLASAPADRASILVVDDAAAARIALTAALSPLGYAIVQAASGLDALRCLLAQNFALILLDIRMPIMDGFVTAGLIRTRRQSQRTPIIFVSAQATSEVAIAQLHAVGAVGFIAAPFQPDELRAKVLLHARVIDVGDFADQPQALAS